MEHDMLKDRLRAAASADAGMAVAGDPDVDAVLATLKTEDTLERTRLRKALWLLSGAGTFYAALFGLTFILPPDGEAGMSQLAVGLFGVLLLVLGGRALQKIRLLSGVDYSAPTTEFLQHLAKRTRIVWVREIAIVILLAGATALALMGGMTRYLPQVSSDVRVIIGAGFWIVGSMIGLLNVRLRWKRNCSMFQDRIRTLRRRMAADADEPGDCSPTP